MCYTQICPRFECRDEHTIHTCVYCVLTLNAEPGMWVCVWVCGGVCVGGGGGGASLAASNLGLPYASKRLAAPGYIVMSRGRWRHQNFLWGIDGQNSLGGQKSTNLQKMADHLAILTRGGGASGGTASDGGGGANSPNLHFNICRHQGQTRGAERFSVLKLNREKHSQSMYFIFKSFFLFPLKRIKQNKTLKPLGPMGWFPPSFPPPSHDAAPI